MKRTPLRRLSLLRSRKTMRTRSRIKPRSTPRRVPEGYRDPDYLAWLRLRPCRVTWAPLHPGWHGRQDCDPHHARHDENGASVGGGLKDDRRAISLCRICHGCIDELSGPFKDWTRERVHKWVDSQIVAQRSQYHATR